MRLKRRHVILAALAAGFFFGLGPAGAVETSYKGQSITWEISPGAPGGYGAPSCREVSSYIDGRPAYICEYSGIYPFVWEPMTFSAEATPAVYKKHVGLHMSYDNPADAWAGVDDWLPGTPAPTLGWAYDTIFWLQPDLYSPWKNTADIIYTAYNDGSGGTPVDYFRLIVRVNLYLDENAKLRRHDLHGGPPDWKDTDFCGRRPHPDDPRFARFRRFSRPAEREGGGPGG